MSKFVQDNYIEKSISKKIIEENKIESELHKPSGKLSASMLNQPLQWQMLKTLYADYLEKDIDEYTLRKFIRGKSVEDWLVSNMDGVVDKQRFVEYRGCIGYVDVLVDMKDYEQKVGVIPHEIKSVTNAKFKRILNYGEPDHGHLLQGALYALALGSKKFAIDYVASDDLRVLTFIADAKDYKDEIDEIITKFDEYKEKKVVPVFEAKEEWQKNKKYNPFYAWMDLDQKGIEQALALIIQNNDSSKKS